jgi:endonuclease/exonuclease/phosphatase (EEP) superfamily protein YafD
LPSSQTKVQDLGSFDRDGQLTQYALDAQAFRTDGLSVRLARNERHIFSRGRQQAADQAANSAGSDHNDFGFGT